MHKCVRSSLALQCYQFIPYTSEYSYVLVVIGNIPNKWDYQGVRLYAPYTPARLTQTRLLRGPVSISVDNQFESRTGDTEACLNLFRKYRNITLHSTERPRSLYPQSFFEAM